MKENTHTHTHTRRAARKGGKNQQIINCLATVYGEQCTVYIRHAVCIFDLRQLSKGVFIPEGCVVFTC